MKLPSEGPTNLPECDSVITALIYGQSHPKTDVLRDILVSVSKLTHPGVSPSKIQNTF